MHLISYKFNANYHRIAKCLCVLSGNLGKNLCVIIFNYTCSAETYSVVAQKYPKTTAKKVLSLIKNFDFLKNQKIYIQENTAS